MGPDDNTPDSGAGEGEELSLREQIDAAFEQSATNEPEKATEGAPAGEQRDRDELGRFTAKQQQQQSPTQGPQSPQEATTQPRQGQGSGITPPPAPGGELKAPASWRPQAREKWGGVDPDVKGEVHRREYEMQQVLQHASGARQFIDAFENVVRPYEMFIRAEQSTPLQAVASLMATAAELRVGTPTSKANLVAGLIRQYGVDLQTLDSILAGQAPQGGAQMQQPQQYYDPRVDQLLAHQQRMQQAAEQYENQQIHSHLHAFAADSKHEFYDDVRHTMADIIEIKARQGEPPDLEKAYAQACAMHEQVSTIMSQRQAASRSSSSQAAVLRAKRAAASVKSDSTPGPGATIPKNDSMRADIEAAFEDVQQRV